MILVSPLPQRPLSNLGGARFWVGGAPRAPLSLRLDSNLFSISQLRERV